VLGAPVRLVRHGRVAALTSRVPDERVRAKRRDLVAHSDVLQKAAAGGVVIPVRFGMVLADEDAVVESFLEPREQELLALIDRFAGTAELRLRVVYQDRERILADVVAGDPTVRRLREASRRSATQATLLQLGERVAKLYAERRAADADAVVERLARHAVDVQRDEPGDELEVVRASFLVRDEARRAFDEELDAVALRLRHLMSFTCVGPVPPHSFVALSAEQER
jgi:hypothetical protein